MDPLPQPPPGPRAWVQYMRELAAGILARTPLRSATCEINETPHGCEILPETDAAAASIAAAVPFAILDASTADTPKIRVRRGPVTTPDGTFVPAGFAAGDTPAYLLDVTGETAGVVWVSVTVNDTTGAVESADNPDFGEEIPDNTATTFYLELGSFALEDGALSAVQSNGVGSLYFELCGGVVPQWGGFNDTP